MKERLQKIRDGMPTDDNVAEALICKEELEDEFAIKSPRPIADAFGAFSSHVSSAGPNVNFERKPDGHCTWT